MAQEDYDAAIARGVDPETGIYAELTGYGSSADGFHITSPAPDGSGATRAMRAALKNAVLSLFLSPSLVPFAPPALGLAVGFGLALSASVYLSLAKRSERPGAH